MSHGITKHRWIVLRFIGAILFLIPSILTAATIVETTEPVMGCNIMVSGVIVQGDAERLERLIKQQGYSASVSPVRRRICFDSPGGNMIEGLAMARVILEAARGTAVAADQSCESACALAFMAGNYFSEGESTVIDRVIHPTARLGFHAPKLEVPTGSYSEAQVQRAFLIALEILAVIAEQRSERAYDFPESLFLTLLRTPSNEMQYIDTVGQASRLKIAVAPSAIYAQDVKQAIANICIAIDNGLLDETGTPYGSSSFVARNVEIDVRESGVIIGKTQDGFRGEAASSCEVNLWLLGGEQATESLGYVIIGNAEGRGEVYSFHSFPPDTRLQDLPIDFPASLRRFASAVARDDTETSVSSQSQQSLPASCWVTSETTMVVNVNDYVNMRFQPNLSSRVVRQIPRGDLVYVKSPGSPITIGTQRIGQQCISACNSIRDGTGNLAVRTQALQCIDDNLIWYEIMDTGGYRGWVSRKFLEEF